jgi:hypothetical protein
MDARGAESEPHTLPYSAVQSYSTVQSMAGPKFGVSLSDCVRITILACVTSQHFCYDRILSTYSPTVPLNVGGSLIYITSL